MYLLFFCAFIGFQTLSHMSFAQSTTSKADLNTSSALALVKAEDLAKKLPVNFEGILYNCDPTCTFISIKQNKNWNPPLQNIKTKISILNPDWILKTDPLYALLIKTLPVKPFVSSEEKDDSTKKKSQAEQLEIPPKTPFDYGYDIGLKTQYSLIKIESDSNLLSQMSPNSTPGLNENLELNLFRAKPYKLLGQWWQFNLSYSTNLYSSLTTREGVALNKYSDTDLSFKFWTMHDGYKIGLKLEQSKSVFKTQNNIMTGFGYSETWQVVGLGILWNRFEFALDYGLSVAVSDELSFRESIQKAQEHKIKFQYCSKDFDISSILFRNCYGGSASKSEITSSFYPNLQLDTPSTIKQDRYQIFYKITFGDDFYL